MRLTRYSTWDDRALGYQRFLSLGFILSSFFGPQYRWSHTARHPRVPLLLNRSVYGDKDSIKERQINERYYDWYLMKEDEGPAKVVDLLPYSFNMEEAWYDEVRNRYGEHGATGWSDEMKFIWKTTYVYGRIKSENVLAIWGDWREMMGL
jgi:hypothetical protein